MKKILIIITLTILVTALYFVYAKSTCMKPYQEIFVISKDSSGVISDAKQCKYSGWNSNRSKPLISVTDENLKTYTNIKFGYKIKYPADWQVGEEKSIIDNVNNIPSLVNISDNDGHSISIEINKKDRIFIYDALIKEDITIGSSTKTMYIFPNGYECYGYEDDEDIRDCSSMTVPIKKDGVYYSLSVGNDIKNFKDIYIKIFGTFEFIE